MGSRRFELTLVAADNLPDIRRLGRMKVYAVVSLNGSVSATNTDRDGETNPTWNFPFVYSINEADLRRGGVDAVVDLYCETTLGGDKLVGRVVVPLKPLFESRGIASQKSLSFPVAGAPCATLYIRYGFEEKEDFVEHAAAGRHELVWGRMTQARYRFAQDIVNY